MKKKLIPKVKSLWELKQLASTNADYEKLLLAASRNLGGGSNETPEQAYRNLVLNAQETDEKGVVAEVNFCRDLI